MADAFLVHGGVSVKQRSPWFVLLLSTLTLGGYLLVWYYKVNRELRDYGKTFATPPLNDNPLEVQPFVASVALSPLSVVLLFVPIWVSSYRTGRRVRRAGELAGSPRRTDLGLGAVLFWLGGILVPLWAFYLQSHLNAAWDAAREGVAETPGAVADAAWFPDPTGRHDYRYWDGAAWSEYVADDGVESVDPLQSEEPEGEAEAPAEPATKTCPDCGEEVRAVAALCRFCGYRFAPAATTSSPREPVR